MNPDSSFPLGSSLSATRLRWTKPKKRAVGVMCLLYGYRHVARVGRRGSGYYWIAGAKSGLGLPWRESERALRTLESAMDEAARYCAETLGAPLPVAYVGPGGRGNDGLGLAGSRLSGKSLQRQCVHQAGKALWVLLRGARVPFLCVHGCAISDSGTEDDSALLEASATLAGTVAEEFLYGSVNSRVERWALQTVRARLEDHYRSQHQLILTGEQLDVAVLHTYSEILDGLQNPISRLSLESLAARLAAQGYLLETSIQAALYPYLELG